MAKTPTPHTRAQLGKIAETVIMALCCAASAAAGDTEFSVISLNVDGLPSKIWIIPSNPDGPGADGTRVFSQFLARKGYDIIATQEDFNYDEELRTALDEDYDCGLWQGDIDLGQVNWLKFWDTKFETDGLRLFWRKKHQLEQETAATWFDAYGRFDHCWDDMVTKGFRRCEMTLASGLRIVVYNMHMDASTESDEASDDDWGDKAARWNQWRQLRDSVIAHLDERPVILMGDMNSLYPRDSIKALFIDPINATQHHYVQDAWVEYCLGGEYPAFGNNDRNVAFANGETFDKILYINPVSGQQLELRSYQMERDYVWDDGTPLGDHYPVSATFAFTERLPNGVSSLGQGKPVSESYYSPDGRRQTGLKPGLNIVRMGDGTVRKQHSSRRSTID